VNSIDPGVTGRKGSIGVPTKDAEELFDENNPVAGWMKSFGPLTPFAVPIDVTRELLGGKARSQIYEAIGRGELDAIKDGKRTLIVVASIARYCARMQPAKIKVPSPRKKAWPSRSVRPATAKRPRKTQDQMNKSEGV
jgi:hypothetical protein